MAEMVRTVTRVVRGQATSDGAGVKLFRVLGTQQFDMLDPFLMLDEFRSDSGDDYIAGFPDHPHRGFETVTYMLAGEMEHGDHLGNKGRLVAGSVQWMTAGRGIVHSEMPKQEDGLMWGFQLWINLPASHKMIPPRYQDIPPEHVPEVRRDDGAVVRVVAGAHAGVAGAVTGIATSPIYLDVRLPAGAAFAQHVTAGHASFAYVYEGAGTLGGRALARGQLGVLSDGDRVEARAGEAGLRFILLAARPINEPVARYGPFVMNTREELIQAFDDFRSGRF